MKVNSIGKGGRDRENYWFPEIKRKVRLGKNGIVLNKTLLVM